LEEKDFIEIFILNSGKEKGQQSCNKKEKGVGGRLSLLVRKETG